MTAPRSRKETKLYNKHRSALDKTRCTFCDIDEHDAEFVREEHGFKVIRNKFPYSIWDSQRVVDHLMIVPVQHTDTLADLTPEQAAYYLKLVGAYEQQGYNLYARAPGSVIKTIVHQHSHLIKTEGAPKKLVFLLRKPYIRIIF